MSAVIKISCGDKSSEIPLDGTVRSTTLVCDELGKKVYLFTKAGDNFVLLGGDLDKAIAVDPRDVSEIKIIPSIIRTGLGVRGAVSLKRSQEKVVQVPEKVPASADECLIKKYGESGVEELERENNSAQMRWLGESCLYEYSVEAQAGPTTTYEDGPLPYRAMGHAYIGLRPLARWSIPDFLRDVELRLVGESGYGQDLSGRSGMVVGAGAEIDARLIGSLGLYARGMYSNEPGQIPNTSDDLKWNFGAGLKLGFDLASLFAGYSSEVNGPEIGAGVTFAGRHPVIKFEKRPSISDDFQTIINEFEIVAEHFPSELDDALKGPYEKSKKAIAEMGEHFRLLMEKKEKAETLQCTDEEQEKIKQMEEDITDLTDARNFVSLLINIFSQDVLLVPTLIYREQLTKLSSFEERLTGSKEAHLLENVRRVQSLFKKAIAVREAVERIFEDKGIIESLQRPDSFTAVDDVMKTNIFDPFLSKSITAYREIVLQIKTATQPEERKQVSELLNEARVKFGIKGKLYRESDMLASLEAFVTTEGQRQASENLVKRTRVYEQLQGCKMRAEEIIKLGPNRYQEGDHKKWLDELPDKRIWRAGEIGKDLIEKIGFGSEEQTIREQFKICEQDAERISKDLLFIKSKTSCHDKKVKAVLETFKIILGIEREKLSWEEEYCHGARY